MDEKELVLNNVSGNVVSPQPQDDEFAQTQVAAYYIWLHKCEDMAHFNDPDTNWRDAEFLRKR